MKNKAVQIMKEFQEGKSPTELISKYNKTTVYRYYKRFKLYQELSQKLWDLIVESL
jgi:hypothetical protein